MSKHTRKNKSRKAMRKGRKATRKMKGGALETINATTLNGVREKIKEIKPRLIGIFIREGEETTLPNGRKIYTDKQLQGFDQEKPFRITPEEFDAIVKKYEITNDKLVKNLWHIKPADKGKYFFQYV